MTSLDFTALSGLVLTSFVATNTDNLLILVFLLGSSARRRAAALLGYLTAVVLVVAGAAVGAAVGSLVDPGWVGYIGVGPIAMGCYLLYQQYGGNAADDGAGEEGGLPDHLADEGRVWFASSMLMFSNSGDSVAVLLPLLAESGRSALLLIVGLYLLLSLVWCALALSIASRPLLARRIRDHGMRWVPWIMIAVGAYVLMDTGTDTLL